MLAVFLDVVDDDGDEEEDETVEEHMATNTRK